ncbi:MAG: acetate kinase, partial [Clostridia bacterium]|nr:acetate kinase [Clostridia bacterium]
MKILVINAGSSSIKYQLFDMETEQLLAKGMCDRIGIEGGNFKIRSTGKEEHKILIQMANHQEAIKLVLD